MPTLTQQRRKRLYPEPTQPPRRRDLRLIPSRQVQSNGQPKPDATGVPGMSDPSNESGGTGSSPTLPPNGGPVGNGTQPTPDPPVSSSISPVQPGHPTPGGTPSTDTGNSGSSNSGADPTQSIPGSGPGDVLGPHNRANALDTGTISAIVLSVILALVLLGVAGMVLWRRRRERRGSYHTSEFPGGAQPGQSYSTTSLPGDTRMAERLRGGLTNTPAGTLGPQYRIEPFAIPRHSRHPRTESTSRLLGNVGPLAGAAASGTGEKQRPQFHRHSSSQGSVRQLPPGAMVVNPHNVTYAHLTLNSTPMGSPATECDLVFELPPTYQSLQQPRPVRRWYQIWPTSPPSPPRSAGGVNGSRSGSL